MLLVRQEDNHSSAVESRQPYNVGNGMKRIGAIMLLGVLSVVFSVQAAAQRRQQNGISQSRDVRKAQKKQAKAQKKYAKSQRKAERKMLKTERKGTKYPPRQF